MISIVVQSAGWPAQRSTVKKNICQEEGKKIEYSMKINKLPCNFYGVCVFGFVYAYLHINI